MHAARLEAQGKTLLYVARDGALVGLLAASDTVRPDVREALGALRGYGVRHIEMVTGDNERVAAALAETLGMASAANLLPEDKIARVRRYQAQADVGLVMGVAGTDVAFDAAHLALRTCLAKL